MKTILRPVGGDSVGRIDYGKPGLNLEEVPVQELQSEKLGFCRLYSNRGELLVLVTNGYGSAWSASLSPKIAPHLLMDARVVAFFYQNYIVPLQTEQRKCKCRGFLCGCSLDEAPMRTFLESLGFEDIYLGGLNNLSIKFIPGDKKFQVREYDGAESICFFKEENWHSS